MQGSSGVGSQPYFTYSPLMPRWPLSHLLSSHLGSTKVQPCSKKDPMHEVNKFDTLPPNAKVENTKKNQCQKLTPKWLFWNFSEKFLSIEKQNRDANVGLFFTKQTISKINDLRCFEESMIPSFRNIFYFSKVSFGSQLNNAPK